MKFINLTIAVALILFACSSDGYSEPLETGSNENTETIVNKVSNGGLELICSTDNAYYFIDKPRENVYLYTELNADLYENNDAKRSPLNLSIVIDRSGSMEGEKLRNAKEAAMFAVKQLNSNDYISIISYGSDVTEVLVPTKVENTHFIINKILNIHSNGGTFLSGGMIKGFEKVKENYNDEYLNRVILLSDGLANEGIVDLDELANIAANWREKEKISLSTFGIGIDFNEDLMTELSEYGSGNYYFISNPEDISAIFEKELNGLTSLVAKNVSMRIEYPDKQLKLDQVYGYKFKEIPGEVYIDFGDMFSEEKKAVMLKFSIVDFKNEDLNFLTKIDFVSTITNAQEEKEISMKSKISPSKDAEKVKENINNFTMQQVIVFESNYAMEKAAKEIDLGNYDEAKKTLQYNKDFISRGTINYGWSEELEEVQVANDKYDLETENYENLNVSEQKIIQKTNKSNAYKIRKKK